MTGEPTCEPGSGRDRSREREHGRGAPAAGTPQPTSDSALVERAARGDGEAFEEIVCRYQDRIYNLLYRMTGSTDDAEDLAQETFMKAYRAITTFRRGAQLFTWLYRIALNEAYSHGRKGRRRREVEGVSLDAKTGGEEAGRNDLIASAQGPALSPARILETAAGQERVQKAISELDEEYRTVVLLRDMEGLDYGQIAELTGATRAAVKSRLHRARLELARKLKDLKA